MTNYQLEKKLGQGRRLGTLLVAFFGGHLLMHEFQEL